MIWMECVFGSDNFVIIRCHFCSKVFTSILLCCASSAEEKRADYTRGFSKLRQNNNVIYNHIALFDDIRSLSNETEIYMQFCRRLSLDGIRRFVPSFAPFSLYLYNYEL